jgi:hypothetical protein
MKRFLICFLITVSLCFLSYEEGMAIPIGPTNFDEIYGTLGTLIESKQVDIQGIITTDIGDAINQVYYNLDTGIYTYVETITPSIDHISEVNTAFQVSAFNNVAGYSFTEASAAGITVTSLDLDPDGTIDWSAVGWQNNETLTLFYQSLSAPGSGNYNVIDSPGGSYGSFAPSPVPEPATMLLFSAGLAGMGLFGRKRFRKV